MTQPAGIRRGRVRIARRCRTVTEAPAFSLGVFAMIVGNAALLGVETYGGLVERHAAVLDAAEAFFLAAFTVEMLLRLAACADRPRSFFRDPWNCFDLLVVAAAFVPLLRENTTLLRLLRLARVLRTARFLPQLRILLIAIGRSLPGTFSFLVVGALILYVYAMLGWMCFAGSDPAHYGSLGRAGLTLFLLMTLEGLGDAVHAGLAASPWSILFYASYVLLASFVLVNVLIGVVLNSLEEAREIEEAAARAKASSAPPSPGAVAVPPAPPAAGERVLLERLHAARRILEEAEALLGRAPAPGGPAAELPIVPGAEPVVAAEAPGPHEPALEPSGRA